MQSNRLIAITGSNRGIGKHLILELLKHPSKPSILMTSRDPNLGQEALAEMKTKFPEEKNRLFFKDLDIDSSQSIDNFVDYIKKNHQKLDILVNNAAINDRNDWDLNYKIPKDMITQIMKTNFFATVQLTEKVLPLLNESGKIIMVSSDLAKLSFQGEKVRQFLDNKMSSQDLMTFAKDFEEKALAEKHIEAGFTKQIYYVSKALLNAYTRWILPNYLKQDQTCISVHPGWIKTRMGGWDAAPQPIEESTISLMTAIEMDLNKSKELQGLFLDKEGKVFEF